jgi:hypothetical protein
MSESLNIVGPAPSPALRDRLLVVESIFHQSPGEDPYVTEHRFARSLQTKEQPFTRKTTAGENWKSLDCGWIERAGMLFIINEEGKFRQTNPTEEELREAAKKIIEVSFTTNTDVWLILPGESMRAYPSNIRNLLVRCRSGTARITAHIFPE